MSEHFFHVIYTSCKKIKQQASPETFPSTFARCNLLKKKNRHEKGLNQRDPRLLISTIAGAVGLMNVNRYFPQEKYRARKYDFLLLAPGAMVNITSRVPN